VLNNPQLGRGPQLADHYSKASAYDKLKSDRKLRYYYCIDKHDIANTIGHNLNVNIKDEVHAASSPFIFRSTTK